MHVMWISGVGAGGAGCASVHPTILICQKCGQNLKKIGQRNFNIFKQY